MMRHAKALVLPNLQNPKQTPSLLFSALSTSPTFDLRVDSDSDGPDRSEPDKGSKKPLHVFFKEAVGLIPGSTEDVSRSSDGGGDELTRKLKELQKRIRESDVAEKVTSLDKSAVGKRKGAASRLYSAFMNKEGESGERVREEDVGGRKGRRALKEFGIKELSWDMEMFLDYLYKKGYFRDANFLRLRDGKVDASCFEDSYSREYVKHAAKGFGRDHQEIAKWLSGRDMKTVAMFGCPSVEKRSVLAAKSLRYFFDIQEHTVCSKCTLKESCKFVNKSLFDSGEKNLRLATVMRVIVSYALEWVEPPLEVPEEIKGCVSRLLRDIMKLSETL